MKFKGGVAAVIHTLFCTVPFFFQAMLSDVFLTSVHMVVISRSFMKIKIDINIISLYNHMFQI